MKNHLGDLMKQAQKMQTDMQKAQQDIANMEVEGRAGGGLVTVVMTGQHELRHVHIDDTLMSDEKALLEDLIAAAVNDASQRVDATSQEKMAGMTAGFNLPPGIKLPF